MFRRQGAVLACAALCLGCVREPLDVPCPDVLPGELVVTELRGGNSDVGAWIEVFNRRDSEIDLRGTAVHWFKLNGASPAHSMVRFSQTVAPQAFAVLAAEERLPGSGVLEISACNESIDQVTFDGLPDEGTFALDGNWPLPATDINDVAANWCVDGRLEGSPGERNPSCV
jgi:hypothetical protein